MRLLEVHFDPGFQTRGKHWPFLQQAKDAFSRGMSRIRRCPSHVSLSLQVRSLDQSTLEVESELASGTPTMNQSG